MRTLLISTYTLRLVVGNKEGIDALAFAVLIKQSRVNSLITHATQRKLKSVFGIGADKLKRLITDGIKLGFLRKENDSLIANRLHGDKGLCYTMRGEQFDDAVRSSKRGKLTLVGVRRMICTAILYNQVSMQQSCEDTQKKASGSASLVEVKRARKRERSMLSGKSYDERFRGLSNKRIQKLIGRKKSTAVKVVRNAVGSGLLNKKWRVEYFLVSGDSFTHYANSLHEREDLHIIVDFRRRSMYTRFSNVYSIKTDLMKLANNR